MYAASINAQRLTFDVFGVWRKNMVMIDRETNSLWQHATGEAIDGPLIGSQLEALPAWETTWGELQATFPESQHVMAPKKFTGVLPKPLLNRALKITHRAKLRGLTLIDKRLDQHEMVIGIVINGVPKAYPLENLRLLKVIDDEIGGVEIQLTYNAKGDRVIVNTLDGTFMQHERQWWLGWSEFHPRTAVFGESISE